MKKTFLKILRRIVVITFALGLMALFAHTGYKGIFDNEMHLLEHITRFLASLIGVLVCGYVIFNEFRY